jgi:hypothetical protein
MSDTDEERRWCEYERQRFSQSEFEFTKDNGWVHKTAEGRHTTAGEEIPKRGGGGRWRHIARKSPGRR